MGRKKIYANKKECDAAFFKRHPEKAAEYSKRQKEKDHERWKSWKRTTYKRHGKEYHLKAYGLSMKQYREILTKQKGGCAICCSASNREKYLCVDHDHRTGTVRGLLCGHCNKGIGFFKDNPKLLDKASRYVRLRRYGTITKKRKKGDDDEADKTTRDNDS
ncbi:hypothetical protein LCGC14_2702080, partial [marine sediment metagenome]